MSLSAPSLAPSVAKAVFALAEEVRSSIRTTPPGAARRKLEYIAYNITILAASPGSELSTHPHSEEPSPLASEAELKKVVNRAIKHHEGPRQKGQTGIDTTMTMGGHPQAQYMIGMEYLKGTAPACSGRPIWATAIFWMMLSSKGGFPPAQKWLDDLCSGVIG